MVVPHKGEEPLGQDQTWQGDEPARVEKIPFLEMHRKRLPLFQVFVKEGAGPDEILVGEPAMAEWVKLIEQWADEGSSSGKTELEDVTRFKFLCNGKSLKTNMDELWARLCAMPEEPAAAPDAQVGSTPPKAPAASVPTPATVDASASSSSACASAGKRF